MNACFPATVVARAGGREEEEEKEPMDRCHSQKFCCTSGVSGPLPSLPLYLFPLATYRGTMWFLHPWLLLHVQSFSFYSPFCLHLPTAMSFCPTRLPASCPTTTS